MGSVLRADPVFVRESARMRTDIFLSFFLILASEEILFPFVASGGFLGVIFLVLPTINKRRTGEKPSRNMIMSVS